MNFRNLNFLYPYGATLNIVEPAAVALSSGTLAIPMNRPICAYYSARNNDTAGRLVVLGSSRILSDTYIDKEQNDKLCQMIFEFFSNKDRLSKDGHMDDTDVRINTQCSVNPAFPLKQYRLLSGFIVVLTTFSIPSTILCLTLRNRRTIQRFALRIWTT